MASRAGSEAGQAEPCMHFSSHLVSTYKLYSIHKLLAVHPAEIVRDSKFDSLETAALGKVAC